MHAARPPRNTEGSEEKNGAEKKEKRRGKHVCPRNGKAMFYCDACHGLFSAALLVSTMSNEPESPQIPELWLS